MEGRREGSNNTFEKTLVVPRLMVELKTIFFKGLACSLQQQLKVGKRSATNTDGRSCSFEVPLDVTVFKVKSSHSD